jgi:CheY-like chemotaxis protein
MPNVNGHLLATELLNLSPRPRVVVFTGVMEPAIVRDLLVRGVDDVITKPCDVKVFAMKMTALFESHQWRKSAPNSATFVPGASVAEQQAQQLEAAFEPLALCVSSSVRDLLRSAGETLPNPNDELGNYVQRLRHRAADNQIRLRDGLEFSSVVTCLPVDRQSVPVGEALKVVGIELSPDGVRLLHTRLVRDAYLALRWPSLITPKGWVHAIAQVNSCQPISHLYEIVGDFVMLDH